MSAADVPRAVVLLSGGMDSAVCLAQARADGYACHALSVDYGQRHRAELMAAARVAHRLGAVTHRVVGIGLGSFGGSALTDPAITVPIAPSEGIPVTYVPARNTVFLAMGLGFAEVLNASAVYTGVNAVDYSGYPDCRPEFLAAFQRLANVATRQAVEGAPVRIVAPLLELSKRDIVLLARQLDCDLAETVSCYQPDDAGRACGACDACRLRRAGFAAAGVTDPTRYR